MMTDINELIAKLEHIGIHRHATGEAARQAVTALRTQQARISELEAERDAAVLAEREACAQIAEREGEVRGDGDGEIWIATKITDAIRARSDGAAAPTPPASVSSMDGEKVDE